MPSRTGASHRLGSYAQQVSRSGGQEPVEQADDLARAGQVTAFRIRPVQGEAGFQDMRRDFEPSIEGTLETGWALIPSAHGKGYATEAVSALIAWADAHFPGRRMTCIISPENQASLRLAAKFGFHEFARSNYHGPIVVLAREAGARAA